MSTTTVRVSEHTKGRIAALSNSTGASQAEIVERAVEALERRVFLEEVNARYAELRRDPAAWAEIQAERAAESGALRDASH